MAEPPTAGVPQVPQVPKFQFKMRVGKSSPQSNTLRTRKITSTLNKKHQSQAHKHLSTLYD